MEAIPIARATGTPLAQVLSWTKDIGMFALNRPIPGGCPHRTSFCDTSCYNVKLYRIYSTMATRDVKNEAAWQACNREGLRETLRRKRKRQTRRIRFMSRGEAFSDYSDIERVAKLAEELGDRLIWIPTRAWRHPLLSAMIVTLMQQHENLRVLASMDPSNSDEEWAQLKAQGWSTMYFGDDDAIVTPNGDRSFKCPKTWKKLHGHCAVCKGGCFNKKRVDVHLKGH